MNGKTMVLSHIVNQSFYRFSCRYRQESCVFAAKIDVKTCR